MTIFTDERCAAYASPGHPERPSRITRAVERLRSQQELPLAWHASSEATERAILRAHSDRHVAAIRHPDDDFDTDTPAYPDIYVHARRSAGGAIDAMNRARKGQAAFSLLRPPGHHATRNHAMGFCYLNCAAIAALEAVADGVNRVAVFDFDVHHGNGTEAILLNHRHTAFYSVHQYPCYPGTGTAHVGDNCFNYPVAPRTPREEYREILKRAIGDLKKFKPTLVAVSAGFDAYARDPIAQETLEAEDFHWLGSQMRALDAPVFSLLEGGYSDDLPDLILAYLRGVTGR